MRKNLAGFYPNFFRYAPETSHNPQTLGDIHFFIFLINKEGYLFVFENKEAKQNSPFPRRWRKNIFRGKIW